MAKRLKMKIAKVFPSFQSCRSKDTATLPTTPVSSLSRMSSLKQRPPLLSPPPPSQPTTRHSSIRRHVSSAFTSVGCGFRSRSTVSHADRKKTPEFQWQKEEKWHVVANVCEVSACPRRRTRHTSISGAVGFDDEALATSLPPPSSAEKKKKKNKKRVTKKKKMARLRISTSSAESGLFSSEGFGDMDDEETEALVSSSSSSELNPRLQTIREKPLTTRRKKKKKRATSKKVVYSPECESPARLSVFQRLTPWRVEGKMRESFAVVKKSEDPYEDFKRSMMEMIVEKEMSDEDDLEQLLHCFLSLNDKQHHGIIVQAFSEIWEALFCRTS